LEQEAVGSNPALDIKLESLFIEAPLL